MTIARTADIDDDGSGATGTIRNNAWKTALYNEIDAALVGSVPVVQTTTSTGTQHDFALTTGATLLRCNNATLLTLTGLAPGTDGQRLDIVAIGAGNVALSDQAAGSTAADRIITNDSGTRTLLAGSGRARLVYDTTTARWRLLTADPGVWTDVAYAGGNFTVSGGGSWTVDSGDQTAFQYLKIGRLCHVFARLDTTSVAATASTLQITIPVAAAKAAIGVAHVYDNSSSVAMNVACFISPGALNVISLQKFDASAFTPSTNLTFVRVSIEYEW